MIQKEGQLELSHWYNWGNSQQGGSLWKFPIWHQDPKAIDTTLVSPIRGTASHAPLAQARPRKQRTSPEFGGHGRARLVVLAAEVGERWSEEARDFVSQLAKSKARSVPRVLAGRAARLGSTVGPLSWRVRVPARLLCPC